MVQAKSLITDTEVSEVDPQDLKSATGRAATRKGLFAIKLWYFSYFGANTAVDTFLAVFFRHVGMQEGQVGLLMAIRPIVRTLTNPLWGILVDRRQRPGLVLVCILSASVVSKFTLGLESSFWMLFVTAAMAHGFGEPSTSIVDALTIQALPETESFGQQRLWGAVSSGSFSLLSGLLIHYTSIQSIFYSYVLLMLPCILASSWMPEGVKQAAPSHPMGTREMVSSFLKKLAVLLGDVRVFSFFAVTVVMGYSMGCIDGFVFLYLEDLGGSTTLMGLTVTITCIAEVPAMYYSGHAISSLGVINVIYLTLIFYVVRLVYYSLLREAWWVLPVELLHGITYGWAFTAATMHASSIAPPGLENTTQGIFSACIMGLGGGLAKICGGFIYHAYGAVVLFKVGATVALLGLLIFWRSNIYMDYYEAAGVAAGYAILPASNADSKQDTSAALFPKGPEEGGAGGDDLEQVKSFIVP